MMDQIKYLLALESYKFMHTNILTCKDDYDKLYLHSIYYILPIVLKKHFIFCLLWLYIHLCITSGVQSLKVG